MCVALCVYAVQWNPSKLWISTWQQDFLALCCCFLDCDKVVPNSLLSLYCWLTLMEIQNEKSITGPVDRNGIKIRLTAVFQLFDYLVWLESEFESCKRRSHDIAVLCLAVCVWHRSKIYACSRYQLRHQATFFCSSLAESEPVWLHHKELKLKLKKRKKKNKDLSHKCW